MKKRKIHIRVFLIQMRDKFQSIKDTTMQQVKTIMSRLLTSVKRKFYSSISRKNMKQTKLGPSGVVKKTWKPKFVI